jgi:hypothetical protein
VAHSCKAVIDGSTISGNTAGDPTDEEVTGSGGGIFNGGAEFLLKHSAVTGNISASLGYGGGISNSGKMEIVDTTVGNNTAPTQGGGIWSAGGTLTLQGVTVVHNSVLGMIGNDQWRKSAVGGSGG